MSCAIAIPPPGVDALRARRRRRVALGAALLLAGGALAGRPRAAGPERLGEPAATPPADAATPATAPPADAAPAAAAPHATGATVPARGAVAPVTTRPGGAATLAPGREPGLGRLAPGLALREQFDLGVGRSFFRDAWVTAPATTNVRDGLGPLFEAHSCASCHPDGGAARAASPPEPAGPVPAGIVLRIALPGRDPVRRAVPDPVYGDQLQRRGIAAHGARRADAAARGGAVGEGAPVVTWELERGRFADGEAFELRRPRARIDDLAYGPLDPAAHVALRRAPAVIGGGLLDAIPEAAIAAGADPDDRDGDGVSGRPNLVWDRARGRRVVGRFGWKAGQPTLRQQVAAAFRDDVGITSALYPEETCSDAEAGCRAAASGADPATGVEIDAALLAAVTDFVAGLGVPARRAEGAGIARGEKAFASAGCAACHTSAWQTGEGRFAALSGQRIAPYTDLLLHDMGSGLDDGQTEFEAAGGEWRTAPLWGIGRAARDPRSVGFLHDGRARTLVEAILWHGGEAQRARDRFTSMTRGEREDLLAFLGSL